MAKVENLIAATKLGEIMGKKKKKESCKKKVACVLAVIGVIAIIAGIAYAVYRYVTAEALEDFDVEFEDDFEIIEDDFDVELKAASEDN